jgi:hypothetical protein
VVQAQGPNPHLNGSGLEFPEGLVLHACRTIPDPTYLKRLRSSLTRTGISEAVAAHDTPALFTWLMDVAA